MVHIEELSDIRFNYTNWRGETGLRDIKVWKFYYGYTEYHPEEQWLVEGYDYDKEAVRVFAMKDMSNVKVVSMEE